MVKTTSPNTAIVCCLALTGVVLGAAPPAQARVTQVVITATESPTFGGKSFGAVGQYERISGQIVGEVDPKDPLNAIIVDIGLAPKNPNGTVSYSTDFQILRPIDRTKGNKRLLYEITNRGRTNALETLNDSKTGNDPTTSGEAGNGFLMRNGYVLLETGWDFSAPRNGKLVHRHRPGREKSRRVRDHRPQHRRIRHRQGDDGGGAAPDLSGRERRQIEGEPHRAPQLRRRADPGAGDRLGLCRCEIERGQIDVGRFRRPRLVRADRAL